MFIYITFLQGKFHEKCIFVKYIAQEASYPITVASNGLQELIRDVKYGSGRSASANESLSVTPGNGTQTPVSIMKNGNMTLALNSKTPPPSIIDIAAISENSLAKLVEVRAQCDQAKQQLNNLIKFDQIDSNSILGRKEDVILWRFLHAQTDYFYAQVSTGCIYCLVV